MIASELNLSSGVEYVLEREWMIAMAIRESVRE